MDVFTERKSIFPYAENGSIDISELQKGIPNTVLSLSLTPRSTDVRQGTGVNAFCITECRTDREPYFHPGLLAVASGPRSCGTSRTGNPPHDSIECDPDYPSITRTPDQVMLDTLAVNPRIALSNYNRMTFFYGLGREIPDALTGNQEEAHTDPFYDLILSNEALSISPFTLGKIIKLCCLVDMRNIQTEMERASQTEDRRKKRNLIQLSLDLVSSKKMLEAILRCWTEVFHHTLMYNPDTRKKLEELQIDNPEAFWITLPRFLTRRDLGEVIADYLRNEEKAACVSSRWNEFSTTFRQSIVDRIVENMNRIPSRG